MNEKELLRQLKKAKSYDKYINDYITNFSNLYYNYSAIQAGMVYYTVFEMLNEEGGYEFARPLVTAYNDALFLDGDEQIKALRKLRNDIIAIMDNVTMYADALTVHEHVLNRVEYRFKNYEVPDIDFFESKIEQFIFGAKEDAVITNDKIKSIVSELPLRMTKKRFYDILNDSVDIYKDSDQKALDDFLYMITTAAAIDTDYKEVEHIKGIKDFMEGLDVVDYTGIDEDRFNDINTLLGEWADKLSNTVGIYMILEECVNNTYVLAELSPYITDKSASTKHALNMLYEIRDNFDEDAASVLEKCTEYLEVLEGRQEDVMDRLMGYEGLLNDIYSEHSDNEGLKALNLSMKLVSSSIFINIDEDDTSKALDREYIDSKKSEIIKKFDEYFKNHSKIVNRAVMSQVIANLPVFFNSPDEVREYINYSLTHCSDESELACSMDVIKSIMEE